MRCEIELKVEFGLIEKYIKKTRFQTYTISKRYVEMTLEMSNIKKLQTTKTWHIGDIRGSLCCFQD